MVSSPWVDVAVAVVFVFFVFSVVVSGLNELLNWVGQVRSKQLWDALHRLCDPEVGFGEGDPRARRQIRSRILRFVHGVRDTFFRIPTGRVDHRPLVRPEGDLSGGAELLSVLRATAAVRSLETAAGGRTSIHHIPPPTFANALQEIGLRGDGELQRVLEGLHVASPLRRKVEDLNLLVSSNAVAFRDHVAGWFDEQMRELSRRYRRDARRVMFVLGLFVAVAGNVNAVHVVASAQRDSDLRQALAASAAEAVSAGSATTCPTAQGEGGASARLQCLRDEIGHARALHVTTFWDLSGPCRGGKPCSGWFRRALDVIPSAFDKVTEHPLAALGRLVGWVVAAIALSFGGAFWFDVLRRVVGYRRSPQVARG